MYPQYSRVSHCVKCHGEVPKQCWYPSWDAVPMHMLPPPPEPPVPAGIILRTCNHCGFKWLEMPFDAEGIPNNTELLREAAYKARARQTEFLAVKIQAHIKDPDSAKAVASLIRTLGEGNS